MPWIQRLSLWVLSPLLLRGELADYYKIGNSLNTMKIQGICTDVMKIAINCLTLRPCIENIMLSRQSYPCSRPCLLYLKTFWKYLIFTEVDCWCIFQGTRRSAWNYMFNWRLSLPSLWLGRDIDPPSFANSRKYYRSTIFISLLAVEMASYPPCESGRISLSQYDDYFTSSSWDYG